MFEVLLYRRTRQRKKEVQREGHVKAPECHYLAAVQSSPRSKAPPIEQKTEASGLEEAGWPATYEQHKLGLSAYYDKR